MPTSHNAVSTPARIVIVTPVPKGSLQGNNVTATRWAKMIRAAGHQVQITGEYEEQRCDALIALHAFKSAPSIHRFAKRHPDKPLIVAMTGTDLYGDIRTRKSAQRSLRLATRLVLLQAHGIRELPDEVQDQVRVIVQSAIAPTRKLKPLDGIFEVCVSGHLRSVKDPFRAPMASRKLPPSSTIQVTHIGDALTASYKARALAEMERNPRYRWLGAVSRSRASQILARSRLLVLSSKSEGGANVISEAVVADTPVLASEISGSIGLLGEEYEGYFDVGDTSQLKDLLLRCEQEKEFYQQLARACRRRAKLFTPEREQQAWSDLIDEVRTSNLSLP